MKLKPYRIVTATNPDDLEEKCNAVFFTEDEDEDLLFFYVPLGAPQVIKDYNNNLIFMQTFQLNSKVVKHEDYAKLPPLNKVN